MILSTLIFLTQLYSTDNIFEKNPLKWFSLFHSFSENNKGQIKGILFFSSSSVLLRKRKMKISSESGEGLKQRTPCYIVLCHPACNASTYVYIIRIVE